MDAHFAYQVHQNTIRTAKAVACRGPARQYGSGELGAVVMRMGRVAMLLVKQYLMTMAKEFWKNLLSAFLPEIPNVLWARKRPKGVLGKRWKKALQKPLLWPPPPQLLRKQLMLAHRHQINQLQVYEMVRPIAESGGAGWSRQASGGERAVLSAAATR